MIINAEICFTFPMYTILKWFSSGVHHSFFLAEFCSYSVVQLPDMPLALKHMPMTFKDIFQYVFEITLVHKFRALYSTQRLFLSASSEI